LSFLPLVHTEIVKVSCQTRRCSSRLLSWPRGNLLAMLVAIILAAIAAIIIPVELVRRPLRSASAWVRKWFRLIRQLPRLEQAIENIAWMIANDEADYGSAEEEHQEAIQALHDFLSGRGDGAGARRKPRSLFG
jgi:hypothetical protein